MAIVDYESTGDNYENGMIGTGPYMVKEFHTQVGYDMVKNPYYRKPVPYDNVKILFMGDASAKANALLAGQIDIAENIMSVSDLRKLQDDPNYTVQTAAGVRCGFSWINFKGVLGNDDLRHAVLMAIDQEAICHSNTIGDLYTAGFSVLPSGMNYGYDTLTNPWKYDPEGAKKLLDDAGIVDTNGNGIRELDGEDIYLRYVSYENRLLNDFSDAHTQYLSKIGIGVKSDYGSADDQWTKLVAFEYDLNNNNWNHLAGGSPTTYLGNWATNSANYCGYQNDEYDALYAKLIDELDPQTKERILQAMRLSRRIRPYESNWLLFSAMVEAFLFRAAKEYYPIPVQYAFRRMEEWYKGDGVYGDGPDLAVDYYNSYVIHPMLLEISGIFPETCGEELSRRIRQRAARYAIVQERLIAPDGSFPIIGRSITYRCGAFHHLANMALRHQLPEELCDASVREALGAVIARTLTEDSFREDGFLNIGVSGHQPLLGEEYISTGSLYLCLTAFLPLGLAPEDPFWSKPAGDWTQKRLWQGSDEYRDHALNHG